MMFTTILGLIACFTAIASGESIFLDCDDPSITGADDGVRCCLSDELPKGCECFDKPAIPQFPLRAPLCPADLGVNFLFYQRMDRRNFSPFKVGNLPSCFDSSKETKIIIHGFNGQGPEGWSRRLKDLLLRVEDVNVILVNWTEGAKGPDYFQAAANTRSVGAMVAKLITELHDKKAAPYMSFHLIGFSLGAHVAGIAGREIQRLSSQIISRISALDAAGPMFEDLLPVYSLAQTDANFVDAIHTNAHPGGLGINRTIGHVDFYPNGGQHQPGCGEMIPQDFRVALGAPIPPEFGCSHGRSRDLYNFSVRRCSRRRADCPMGYHATPSPSCMGPMKLETATRRPFCPRR